MAQLGDWYVDDEGKTHQLQLVWVDVAVATSGQQVPNPYNKEVEKSDDDESE